MKKLKFIINIILIFILINSNNSIVKALKEEKNSDFTICIDAGHQKNVITN